MKPSRDPRSSRIEAAAALLVDAFDDYNARFSDITRRAERHFRRRDWARQGRDARARIRLYDDCIAETIGRLEGALAERLLSRSLWLDIHARYAELIDDRLDAELYKTFFNTTSRRLFKTRGVDAGVEFVALDIEPTAHITRPVDRRIYGLADDPVDACRRLLAEPDLGLGEEALEEGAAALAERLNATLADDGGPLAIELLKVPFFRDRRAYRIGRVLAAERWRPCVIALDHPDDGVRVDAVLLDRTAVSILFGFTYSYFHADLPTVGDAIVFLRTLLPDKPVDELYTVLGRAKQGKTERYRRFFHHLGLDRDDRLVEADGKRGMVMVVFTLPSFPLVFKVVRDHFAPGKKIGREHVLAQYRYVFNHDRVGRLIDAQEYRHLAFARDRFDPAALEELLNECARAIELRGDTVLVRHCFVQRRVRPLDLFVREQSDEVARAALLDYGQAVRDLARSNLFPGDLFLKNFGVTRSGRAVFYDYDEVSKVTDLNVRRVPPARSEEEEFADTPWYPVNPGDVFPEQFPRFMDLPAAHRRAFHEAHGELFDPDWWSALKQRLIERPDADVRPYAEAARLQACRDPGA
ncbi:bifunctional isocitrate dehydrogenase kinase/phosphatase [Wenzhouxiangella sp. XN79A]|uniref:bifunctional isocitrate dehydrogenase kinase/phosphatase n=1 Tax=Wenzhouxiangella sp. XN79A TaxID=2724193 RepID=UPI00144A6AEF|nr:bifunctional isocitrate dehydrogenase kinase/phosphatase [Wenzhouxiangella sp. XN79A]NKI36132.1 bifunctional isocitrate dehydrogenase kinase/phosphatase [Wenzhouxiangella sp. XN79A]